MRGEVTPRSCHQLSFREAAKVSKSCHQRARSWFWLALYEGLCSMKAHVVASKNTLVLFGQAVCPLLNTSAFIDIFIISIVVIILIKIFIIIVVIIISKA